MLEPVMAGEVWLYSLGSSRVVAHPTMVIAAPAAAAMSKALRARSVHGVAEPRPSGPVDKSCVFTPQDLHDPRIVEVIVASHSLSTISWLSS